MVAAHLSRVRSEAGCQYRDAWWRSVVQTSRPEAFRVYQCHISRYSWVLGVRKRWKWPCVHVSSDTSVIVLHDTRLVHATRMCTPDRFSKYAAVYP